MKIILGVVFLVVLAVGGVFLWKKLPKKDDKPGQNATSPSQRPEETVPTSTSPDVFGEQIGRDPVLVPSPVPPRTGRDEFSTPRP
ncbi:MAG: hypothetical protein A2751_03520 [Candidatus Doudnabacteria bacterium RIFCSPHIGHO2_01_FULL_46_14]|uniref:Uncharacterized protein n=1 Tax=Candidatus Doudnabacteria bacterium RIFCSPHIGHO2_01_FULL_46_14 TaxID=1817824 RepID=A0A1F5NKJ6_9BACT|nr:MAG: hypothetical protein A2751_03520 [Candidatus Doudnabacteria bacterium RIFCSPHIGHO2_01_FULL_46_14]